MTQLCHQKVGPTFTHGIRIAFRSAGTMANDNIVSLNAVREIKAAEEDDSAYRIRVLGMDKLELLEEMVRFQEERSRVGHLTPGMMIRGRHLFRELERTAETREMRLLTSSYRRHLDHELAAFMKNGQNYPSTHFSDYESEER